MTSDRGVEKLWIPGDPNIPPAPGDGVIVGLVLPNVELGGLIRFSFCRLQSYNLSTSSSSAANARREARRGGNFATGPAPSIVDLFGSDSRLGVADGIYNRGSTVPPPLDISGNPGTTGDEDYLPSLGVSLLTCAMAFYIYFSTFRTSVIIPVSQLGRRESEKEISGIGCCLNI